MCGLAGVAYAEPRGVSLEMLARMAAAIRHRGPDGYGFLCTRQIGFAHVRLSIRDIEKGTQPMSNEDNSVVVIFNGEIYNDSELRAELIRHGHRFRTASDTEILVHGYEQWGEAMLPRLNGQFAFVIYDRAAHSLFLSRDRFGICPLFYALRNGSLYFGSEAKALFASGEIPQAVDPEGLDDIFTFWAARAPRTPFRGVRSLEPGTYAIWRQGVFRTARWHEFDYSEPAAEPPEAVEQLDGILRNAVALRLQADVPVGAYLSGGLDSSCVTALAAHTAPLPLRTFSITFERREYDESAFQRLAAQTLQTKHEIESIGDSAIARIFPDVIRHAETPLVRTAPAPLFLLSKLARKNGIKVVLTGEGADEIFLGYDLFKETALRQFCARAAQSAQRPKLFKRLYPYVTAGRGGELWAKFFLSAGAESDPLFSHQPRILLTSWIKQLYSPDFCATLRGFDAAEELRQTLPEAFWRWSSAHRAAYLETRTLLSSYLLAAQGDRMLSAHGVEGRYPFLDPALADFAAHLPVTSKRRGLKDKLILRRWARSVLPEELAMRPKLPYRAPGVAGFLGGSEPDYVADLLSPAAIKTAGIFEPRSVNTLLERCRSGRPITIREEQAFVGVLSTQLFHRQFMEMQPRAKPLNTAGADVIWTDSNSDRERQVEVACYGAA
jgi:asparagine synthase (glutamine-hydrolysing)